LESPLFCVILAFKLMSVIIDSTLAFPVCDLTFDVFIAMMVSKVGYKKLFVTSLIYDAGVLLTLFDRLLSYSMLYYSVNPRFWFAYPMLCIIGIAFIDFVWILLLRKFLKNKLRRLTTPL